MKRKDFYHLAQPLSEKLYRFAYTLIPDDLQAEQLVIDGLNAFLLKEKKNLLAREVDVLDKKDSQITRKFLFKGILKHMSDIGIRRHTQLAEQMRLTKPQEFKSFYALEPKVRLVVSLRYDYQFTVDDIQDISQMPRYEIIEKLHNGRFLLMNDLHKGVSL